MSKPDPKLQEIKTISKRFTFKLTEQDYSAKAKALGSLREDLDRVEADFAKAKAAFKDSSDTLGGEIRAELRIIRAGEEERLVDCEEVYDYARAIVYWLYQGQIMGQRTMEMAERQMSLVPDVPAIVRSAPAAQPPPPDDLWAESPETGTQGR